MPLRRIEESYLFKPAKELSEDISTFGFAEQFIDSSVGRLHVLYKVSPSAPCVVFAHGNTGNVSYFAKHYRVYQRLGYGLLTFDYPGYGQSGGIAGEDSFYASLEAAMDLAEKIFERPSSQIHLHGLSLGGAVAVEIASRRKVASLIVESGFLSTHAMAGHIFGRWPVWLLFKNRFVSSAKVGKLDVPKFFLHGRLDEVVPHSHTLRLFELAAPPKFLHLAENANHSDQCEIEPEIYQANLRHFIEHGRLPSAQA
jgi:uncharacterized protein